MYCYGGLQNYPIEDFLPPYKQLANLCGLQWEGYIYSGGLSYANRHDEKILRQMKDKAINHAYSLAEKIKKLEYPYIFSDYEIIIFKTEPSEI